jgi:hypothetical protein
MGPALGIVLSLGLMACGGPGPSADGSAIPTGAVPSPSAASVATPSDAATALASALAPFDAASEFESSVTVDGEPVTLARGRTVGVASALTVTAGGRTVEYVRLPPNAWAREPGGSWVVVDAEQTPDSPLDALAAPLSIERRPGDPGLLRATYSAAALGLEGDPVTVEISIDGDAVTFRYATTSGGRSVASTTVLRPATDPTPIVAPSAQPGG